MSPLCFLLVSALLPACREAPEAPPAEPAPLRQRVDPAGQQQGITSPSGFVARVPIVSMEGRDFATYWCPELRDADGGLLLRDREGFPARFNVYWAWDAQDRLWLYNSDDGAVVIYAAGPEAWARSQWVRGSEPQPPEAIQRLIHP
jgi:hypothetical protein